FRIEGEGRFPPSARDRRRHLHLFSELLRQRIEARPTDVPDLRQQLVELLEPLLAIAKRLGLALLEGRDLVFAGGERGVDTTEKLVDVGHEAPRWNERRGVERRTQSRRPRAGFEGVKDPRSNEESTNSLGLARLTIASAATNDSTIGSRSLHQ